MQKQLTGWALFVLVAGSSIISTVSYPNQPIAETGFVPARGPQPPAMRIERKFAEKPNAIKKVALDDFDDLQTNQIQESAGGGFSWSNLLGMVMQMIFNPGGQQGPNKSEGLDDGTVAPSPWANLLSVGLKILTAILGGGGGGGDGIDKVDNGSPMQGILAAVLSAVLGDRNPEQVNSMAKQAGEFINIVVNLLDALKTSFSHRAIAARNIGKKDASADAFLAGVSVMKGYVKSMATVDPKCLQKFMCEANSECSNDIGRSSFFCHVGNYLGSLAVEKSTSGVTFEQLYEAGVRGRSSGSCHQAFIECSRI